VTLSTAGLTSTFMINSVDAFQNLRPGGDDMSVVFRLAGSTDIPSAGKVSDNNDGSYMVQYAITQAGRYTVSISVNGVVGVGSPFDLRVEAELADTSLTYAYGEFLDASTGKTFSVYVQTRDKYGNFISTDPAAFPDGNQNVQLEYCSDPNLGGTCPATDAQCTCQGGTKNNDVSIIVNYAVGPNGPTRNGQLGGERYLGLYQITYFPFTSGKSTPLVRHNGVYIKCYFHTATPVYEVPVTEADACVRDNIIKQLLNQASTARSLTTTPQVARHAPLQWNAAGWPARVTSFEREVAEEQAKLAGDDDSTDIGSLRRNVQSSQGQTLERHDFTADDNDRFQVKETFEQPSTRTQRDMLSAVPALCFVVGTGIAVLQFLFDFYGNFRRKRLARIHDEYIKGLEAKGITAASSVRQAPGAPANGWGDDEEPASGEDGGGEGGAGAGPAEVPTTGVEVPAASAAAGNGDANDNTPEGGASSLNSPEGQGDNVTMMAAGQDLGASMDSEIQPVRAPPSVRDLSRDSQDSVSKLIDDAS